MYKLLKEKKKRISAETEQALLELLAYNAEVILPDIFAKKTTHSFKGGKRKGGGES